MSGLFNFGEKIAEYEVKVLNEREVRASAGILFLFAIISFLNAWLIGNYQYIKIFIVVFLADFTLRVFVNPKYSPTLILGRILVSRQKVEYVGAAQKRFAWALGFVLALTMFYVLVIKNIIGPVNLFVCLTCLLLLFFETSFGICIGCTIYNLFHRKKAELCPGNACGLEEKEDIQRINLAQVLVVAAFFLFLYGVTASPLIKANGSISIAQASPEPSQSQPASAENPDCVVPDWAKKIGHEEKWKLHHGCQ